MHASGKKAGMQVLLCVVMILIFTVIFTGKITQQRKEGVIINGQKLESLTAEQKENKSSAKEQNMADLQAEENGETNPALSSGREGGVVMMDLNFDGWEDLCYQGWDAGGMNIPYYCSLWNQQSQRFEYSAELYNVETDPEKQWISCRVREGAGEYRTTYYRYDENNCLHMVRYVEENQAGDALFKHLDLNYVDDGGMYTLSAIAEGDNLALTMTAMAKQALEELYLWTGDKVDTAYFQVSNMGGVTFATSPEDMRHSRIFFARYFGTDTEYNISGYDKSISSIDVASGRAVWYSPILWKNYPEDIGSMTEEEVVTWYFEKMSMAGIERKVKTTEHRYQDIWTIQAQSGEWFEVIYNAELQEVFDITGPYPSYPSH